MTHADADAVIKEKKEDPENHRKHYTGGARRGSARHGRHGRHGVARPGAARPGTVRRGEDR